MWDYISRQINEAQRVMSSMQADTVLFSTLKGVRFYWLETVAVLRMRSTLQVS